jgi:sulfatase modifying factor 1
MPAIENGQIVKTTQVLDDLTHLPGMVLVPEGPFQMGSEGWGQFECPVHEVHLDGFWIDETPVTNAQFSEFVRHTGFRTEAEKAGLAWGFAAGKYGSVPGLSWRSYSLPGREDHPVVVVTWNDASAYARWAGKRLPTEAEWEKAARGGSTGNLYPWGNELLDGCQCNFGKNPADVPPTTAVKEHRPNRFGIYDLVGNVWQWCADWYSEGYYVSSPRTNPTGPCGGVTRVRRGGSWNVIQSFRLRCANRGAMDPSSAVPNVGFRCAS